MGGGAGTSKGCRASARSCAGRGRRGRARTAIWTKRQASTPALTTVSAALLRFIAALEVDGCPASVVRVWFTPDVPWCVVRRQESCGSGRRRRGRASGPSASDAADHKHIEQVAGTWADF
eukprot:1240519-Rhodomonas_salina.2